jgi:uncharacterized protein YyaL (SSP411 family)
VAVVGAEGDPLADAMHARALARFVPRRIIHRLAPEAAGTAALPPALSGMLTAADGPRGYVCTGTTCGRPAETLEAWEETLEALGRPRVLD